MCKYLASHVRFAGIIHLDFCVKCPLFLSDYNNTGMHKIILADFRKTHTKKANRRTSVNFCINVVNIICKIFQSTENSRMISTNL